MIRVSILFIAAVTLTQSACSKKSDGGGAAAGKSDKGGATADKSDKPAAIKLPKVDNLQIDVTGEATVGDGIMGDGNLVQGATVGALMIEVPKAAQTLDEAKSDANMFTPKNLKADTLADGWALTYDNTGSMGANYFVDVRRTIGGKTYKCSTTTGDANQAAGALAACKSLRK